MKKREIQARKLRLFRETLRSLQTTELQPVAGGTESLDVRLCGGSCESGCPRCCGTRPTMQFTAQTQED
jgi:hypothetical protein